MIKNEKEYKTTTEKIELLLQKATKKGGFEKLTTKESTQLNELSVAVNKYEKTHYSIPMPKTIDGILELKMFEKKLKQKEMARLKVDGNLLLEIVA